ncbi:MAG: PIG-L family deacetylase [Chloroflexi bacterium SZAS-1]|nr:PIG-L family deacetylase [Chloroflexi bacterium SZAS-1]HNP87852.1 PIG-L family deacetylase [Kouleothrix sp.]
MTTSLPAPRCVLAVMAHPDDIEFMAGGLVAQWAAAGIELHYCLLTDGNSGSRDPLLTPQALATIRRAEQQAAGALFNVASYTFLGRLDGRLVANIDLRLAIAREIRRIRPDTILTCDPRFMYSATYINHPDHRAAAEATLAATMPLANTRLAAIELLDEGLEPHDVSTVYLAIPDRATTWIPLTPHDLELKIAAMQAHKSQVGDWDASAMIKGFAMASAEEARRQGIDCQLAEAYVRIVLRQHSAE